MGLSDLCWALSATIVGRTIQQQQKKLGQTKRRQNKSWPVSPPVDQNPLTLTHTDTQTCQLWPLTPSLEAWHQWEGHGEVTSCHNTSLQPWQPLPWWPKDHTDSDSWSDTPSPKGTNLVQQKHSCLSDISTWKCIYILISVTFIPFLQQVLLQICDTAAYQPLSTARTEVWLCCNEPEQSMTWSSLVDFYSPVSFVA